MVFGLRFLIRYAEHTAHDQNHTQQLEGGEGIAHKKNAGQYGDHRCEIGEDHGPVGGDVGQGVIDKQKGTDRGHNCQIQNGNPEGTGGEGAEQNGRVCPVLDQSHRGKHDAAQSKHDVCPLKGGEVFGGFTAENGEQRTGDHRTEQQQKPAEGAAAKSSRGGKSHTDHRQYRAESLKSGAFFPKKQGAE